MEFNAILSKPVLENIIQYLNYRDICNFRSTCHSIKNKMSKSIRYGIVLDCASVKINRKHKIADHKRETKHNNLYGLKIAYWIIKILVGAIYIPINIIFGKATVIRKLVADCKLMYRAKMNKRKTKIYYKSLTHVKYFEITKIMAPHVTSPNFKDLQICVIYNNVRALKLLNKKYNIFHEIELMVIMFDRIDMFKIIANNPGSDIFQVYRALITCHKLTPSIYHSPKIMKHYLSQVSEHDTNHIQNNMELYKSIRDGAIKYDALEMADLLELKLEL
jgi:hypothetical protein